MADHIHDETLDNPTNTKSENFVDEITLADDTAAISQNQETENMEVHHHSHPTHGKKTWKNYFWEFLMLFLAVFCGFLAEWQLEHVIENSREKEFIKSMIEDAQIDTLNIKRVIHQNEKQLVYIDSLSKTCFNYQIGKSSDYEIYRLFRKVISVTESVKPTERTLLQLKNSGGMRLIRNKAAADAMIFYDGIEKDVKTQYENTDKVVYDFVTASYELFNFKYLDPGRYANISAEAKLLSHDTIKLTQFANVIFSYGATFYQYNAELRQMNETAIKLIALLRKEYHLTE